MISNVSVLGAASSSMLVNSREAIFLDHQKIWCHKIRIGHTVQGQNKGWWPRCPQDLGAPNGWRTHRLCKEQLCWYIWRILQSFQPWKWPKSANIHRSWKLAIGWGKEEEWHLMAVVLAWVCHQLILVPYFKPKFVCAGVPCDRRYRKDQQIQLVQACSWKID